MACLQSLDQRLNELTVVRRPESLHSILKLFCFDLILRACDEQNQSAVDILARFGLQVSPQHIHRFLQRQTPSPTSTFHLLLKSGNTTWTVDEQALVFQTAAEHGQVDYLRALQAKFPRLLLKDVKASLSCAFSSFHLPTINYVCQQIFCDNTEMPRKETLQT
eukprot:m.78538 g.78538  ORF g.78538 m.78538 type:complete len:163 (-) comp20765_c1_seq3:58-546(-)